MITLNYEKSKKYDKNLVKNLKYLRDKKNVTQILAEEMTGIDRTTISAYEFY